MKPHTPDTDRDESSREDPHPHQPGSNEASQEKQTTPAGVVRDLEEMADEAGATTPAAPPDEGTDVTR
jgi:hypothetical protein